MLEKRKLVPNWTVTDTEGKNAALWDFRQKTHYVLLWDPNASAALRAQWRSAITADQKQWDWLHVQFLILSAAPPDLSPGIHAIDRFGTYLNTFPLERWTFDDIEREFIYNEARHC